MRAMNFQKFLVPVGALVVLGVAWRPARS